jgi:hypothetical protein
MAKRRRFFLGSGFVATLIVAGAIVVWSVTPTDRINEETFKLIRNGMTQPEIEAILMVPPGDYSNGAILISRMDPELPDLSLGDELPMFVILPVPTDKGPRIKHWIGSDICLVVFFDSEKKVEHAFRYSVVYLQDESMLDKMRRWLGWRPEIG